MPENGQKLTWLQTLLNLRENFDFSRLSDALWVNFGPFLACRHFQKNNLMHCEQIFDDKMMAGSYCWLLKPENSQKLTVASDSLRFQGKIWSLRFLKGLQMDFRPLQAFGHFQRNHLMPWINAVNPPKTPRSNFKTNQFKQSRKNGCVIQGDSYRFCLKWKVSFLFFISVSQERWKMHFIE